MEITDFVVGLHGCHEFSYYSVVRCTAAAAQAPSQVEPVLGSAASGSAVAVEDAAALETAGQGVA